MVSESGQERNGAGEEIIASRQRCKEEQRERDRGREGRRDWI